MASYLGAVHPVGDSLAVFRIWIAGGVALVGLIALLASAKRAGWLAIVFAAVAGGPIAAMVYAPSGEAPAGAVTIYTKNTLGGWGDDAAITADILDSGADIVLLQELSQTRSDFGGALQDTHPHQHVCRFSDWSGMAVFSRWPVLETYCSPHRSFAAAQVDAPGGPVWAVSTHLVWPYPHAQARYLEEALPFLESVEGRVIVAGDFNMVPWGYSVRQIEEATGTGRIGPLFTTIEVRDVPLQIDHVLTNGTGMVERRPRLGSDHYGLVAQIGWE
ncbi:endonuclease/exonuclease/phosphatase family protein [Gymnodinialimonas hymeniacidonis]|uniref:endonuclease/exonuclease/phosphatase family protein n=1 Tax=Gymnodinialimonas hymeniacidonis TaxID=3126508 RepID=UPI0034C5BF0A